MKQVALLGVGPSVNKFDWSRDIEVWGLNYHYARYKRWDLWFDIHRNDAQDKHITQANYPLDSALALRGRNFKCSMAYMIAYAILEGYTRIEIWGADYKQERERRQGELACVREWVAYARGLGIEVYIPKESPLDIGDRLYGFEYIP